jgi:hypothetical protein
MFDIGFKCLRLEAFVVTKSDKAFLGDQLH